MSRQEQLEKLAKFGTATIHEAMGQRGNLPYEIKPLAHDMRICGPAYPIKAKAFSNINFHRAYAHAKPGDIIVADCSGGYEAGYWGDLLTLGAMKHGIAGLVIDACVRDADEIEKLRFPIFCRGTCIKGTGKDPEGLLNEPIVLGDVTVNPGDIIVGDRDGLVVVPHNEIDEAIEKSIAREAKEAATRDRLSKGESSLRIYGWDKKFGY